MSANLCTDEHLIFLAAASLFGKRGGHRAPERVEEYDAIIQMLHRENVASVNHRYNEREEYQAPTYVAAAKARYLKDYFTLVPVGKLSQRIAQVFKSIDCYEYQSCEHDGWEKSQAHAFCQDLRRAWGRKIPGYENDAEWGAPDFDQIRRDIAKDKRPESGSAPRLPEQL